MANSMTACRRPARIGFGQACKEYQAGLSKVVRAGGLAEQHKVPFQVQPEHAKDVLSLDVREIWLEDVLDLICLKARIDWSTDGQAIYLGRSPD